MGKFDDIIYLNRPVSEKYPPMPMSDRAAQFSPFAALTGYDDAISETGRETALYIEPDQDMKDIINQKLVFLSENIHKEIKVSVLYFSADGKKQGGEYKEALGTVKKIDKVKAIVVMDDDNCIPIEKIKDIVFL